MKARRSSLSALASMRRVCWRSNSDVILLKVAPRWPRSPSEAPGRHLNMQVAGGDLVGGANEPADRSDKPVGPSEAEPDRREQHRQGQHHEHGGKAEFEAVPVGLEASPHVGDERGVLGDLGRQRVDPARGVEELSVGAGDRPNADENVADPEKAAERLAVQGVLEVGRVGPGDQLFVRAFGDHGRRSVALHQGRGSETQRLRPRAEVVLELRRIGAKQQGAARNVAGRQLDVPQQRPALGFAIAAGSPGSDSLMKAATSLMKRGLMAHSTETVATTAVTIAGIAATSENSATNRLCRRAPARAAFLADLSRRKFDADQNDKGDDDEAVADQAGWRRRSGSGRIGVKPAKTRNVASASTNAAPTATGPNRAVGPLSSKGVDPRSPPLVVVAVKIPNPPAAPRRIATPLPVAMVQHCCLIATIWRQAIIGSLACPAGSDRGSSCAACCD